MTVTSPSPKIGVFDSGIGGLTVVQHLHRSLPQCCLVYCADTAHTPYGSRTPAEVTDLSLAITRFLLDHKIDILVIACGTASVCAREAIKEAIVARKVSTPIYDVIAPLASAAAATYPCGTLALLATPTTITAKGMTTAIETRCPGATILPLSCPQFVPLLEQQLIDPEVVSRIVEETLAPLSGKNLDAALLGCTHYPLLTEAVSKQLGNIPVLDLSLSCAQAIKADLDDTQAVSTENTPLPELYVSADPQLFHHIAQRVIPESAAWSISQVDWSYSAV